MNALACTRQYECVCTVWVSEPQAASSVFLVYTGTTQDYHLGSILITQLSRRAQKNAKSNLSDPHSSRIWRTKFPIDCKILKCLQNQSYFRTKNCRKWKNFLKKKKRKNTYIKISVPITKLIWKFIGVIVNKNLEIKQFYAIFKFQNV